MTTPPPHASRKIHHSSKATATMQTSNAMTTPDPSRKISSRKMEGSVSVLWLIGIRAKKLDLVLLVWFVNLFGGNGGY